MTSQFLAMLAAAGLVTAGVSATVETRSVSALPSMTSFAGVAPARAAPTVDCKLDENLPLDVCKDAGKAGAAPGGNVGAGAAGGAAAGGGGSILLPALLGVVGVGGIAAGLSGSSKG